MSQLQSIKAITEGLKIEKCQRKDCLSGNRGNLQVVWFGKQYETKQMTCSCCYILNDAEIKKSLPTTYNVLPLLKFNDKLLEEYKIYEERKKTASWHPQIMREKKAQITMELNNFQNKLITTLSNLELALQSFLKKVETKNKQIFTHQIMNDIIDMKGKNSFEGLLDKINLLVKQLNYSEITKNYEFQKIDQRNKKLEKQKEKIGEVVKRVELVLSSLLEDIKKRNQTIAKI